MKIIYHKPVMLKEAIQGLKIDPDGVYVDVTFGGGGHSRAILQNLSSRGKLFAFDQDKAAHENSISDDRFHLIDGNFSHLKRHLKFCGITTVDGILADFGVSSHQFDSGSRGFSTRLEGPLDMRMNTQSGFTAREVINEYSAEELYQIFKNYGELRNAKKLADHIVKERSKTPIETTHGLVNLLTQSCPSIFLINLSHKYFKLVRIESIKS